MVNYDKVETYNNQDIYKITLSQVKSLFKKVNEINLILKPSKMKLSTHWGAYPFNTFKNVNDVITARNGIIYYLNSEQGDNVNYYISLDDYKKIMNI